MVFLGRTRTKQRVKSLAQGNKAVPPGKLAPATPRSRVKHSTTERTTAFLGQVYVVNTQKNPKLKLYDGKENTHSVTLKMFTPVTYVNFNRNLSVLEIFTNIVDPNEMPVNVASHQALTCFIWYISTDKQHFSM